MTNILGEQSLESALKVMEAADLIGRTDVAITLHTDCPEIKKAIVFSSGRQSLEEIELALKTLAAPNKNNPQY